MLACVTLQLRASLLRQVLFFFGGWLFFMKQLFRDYEVQNRLVQLLFSATFALSCAMFELIIFEIVDFLHPRSVGNFVHTFLTSHCCCTAHAICIGVLPSQQCYSCSSCSFRSIARTSCSATCESVKNYSNRFRCSTSKAFAVNSRELTVMPLTLLSWSIFIYFFWKIGDPFPIHSPKHGK